MNTLKSIGIRLAIYTFAFADWDVCVRHKAWIPSLLWAAVMSGVAICLVQLSLHFLKQRDSGVEND